MAVLPDTQLYAWRHNPLSPPPLRLQMRLKRPPHMSKLLAVTGLEPETT